MNHIWLDVTDLVNWNWNRPPIGVIRVERELVRWSLHHLREIKYFKYDSDQRKFLVVEKDAISNQLGLSYCDLAAVSTNCMIQPQNDVLLCGEKLFSNDGFSYRSEIKSLLFNILKNSYRLLLAFVATSYRPRLNALIRERINGLRNLKYRFTCWSKSINKKHNISHPFEEHDMILCAGMTWNYASINDAIAVIKSQMILKFYVFCYDLIPFKLPHLRVIDADCSLKYFSGIAKNADYIFCVSKCTEQDWRDFTSKIKASHAKSGIVLLGSQVRPEEMNGQPETHDLVKTEYILLVSTIEKRKNHECIYKALLYLLEKGRKNLPKLVFVGSKGSGVTNFLSDLGKDPRVKDKIIIFSEVSDKELEILYKNSLFTVFPSYYEGWGLPIAESLSYGKMVIASNASSIPEIGGDLVDYVHPHDIMGWAERIAFYLDHRDELTKKERLIRENYTKNSWDNFGQQVFSKIIL